MRGKTQCSRVAVVEQQDDESAVITEEEEEGLQPVTWDELARLRKDCDRLLDIFAEHVADVAAADRKKDPSAYMRTVCKAVSARVCDISPTIIVYTDILSPLQGNKNRLPNSSGEKNNPRTAQLPRGNRIAVQTRRK